ncbi:phage virion morphogenesis protein [Pseudomonas tohonis]|uniref:Bacteriophage tail completion protein S n=1 Tax=Pseudomonas tohonis TaxID=2725477 RepID=A0ABQ4W0U3_9PSED|nr:phage virion morphogenesis protein [Pseudomonas tohonis]GJN53053.1 bacteriophage tail completion protein S [Pseudomonas tohonis]
MTDNLNALEEWASLLLAKLSPGERRKLGNTIGRELRRNQQKRIAAQRNPDGTPYAARKPRQLRGKVGRIKRQMFARLRQAKHLRLQSTADAIAIAFTGRVARIARVHQYGLRDRPGRDQADVQYERRELLGFTDADLEMIRDSLLTHLTA